MQCHNCQSIGLLAKLECVFPKQNLSQKYHQSKYFSFEYMLNIDQFVKIFDQYKITTQ